MWNKRVIDLLDGWGKAPPGFWTSVAATTHDELSMTEPFKITWKEPEAGPLPAGSKVRRDTGLVGELVSAGHVYQRGVGYELGAFTMTGTVLVNFGGKEVAIGSCSINGVGLRDDGLLWTMPQYDCPLPAGLRLRLLNGLEDVVTDGGADYFIGVYWNVVPRVRGAIKEYVVTAIGFPRPHRETLGGPTVCDYCGAGLPSSLNALCRSICGIRYASCAGHDVGDAEFLAGALKLREQESDAELRARVASRYREQEPGIGGPHPPVDKAAIREAAERAERIAKREQLTLAKKARLGDMLRAPFAQRFQVDEPAWRKR